MDAVHDGTAPREDRTVTGVPQDLSRAVTGWRRPARGDGAECGLGLAFGAVGWLRSVDDNVKGRRRKVAIGVAAVLAVLVAGMASAAVGQGERLFSDVPADEPNRTAIEWAVGAGITLGYDDGTFRPAQPLSKRHALVFLERYYDEILGAEESEDFTRGDMMGLLHAIDRGFPLLNRTNCGHGVSTGSVGPFVLLEGHHGVEFWIADRDGSKYKGTLAVSVTGRETSRLFPYDANSDNELARRTGEWFTVHRARVSQLATIDVFTNEPAKWSVCITARRLEEIGLDLGPADLPQQSGW